MIYFGEVEQQNLQSEALRQNQDITKLTNVSTEPFSGKDESSLFDYIKNLFENITTSLSDLFISKAQGAELPVNNLPTEEILTKDVMDYGKYSVKGNRTW